MRLKMAVLTPHCQGKEMVYEHDVYDCEKIVYDVDMTLFMYGINKCGCVYIHVQAGVCSSCVGMGSLVAVYMYLCLR